MSGVGWGKRWRLFQILTYQHNRANIGTAILSNFETARDAIEKMSHAMGDADKEMDVITHSLSYKINNLKETFTGIWQNLIDRGELGAVVDAFSAVIGVVEKLTGLLGGFGTIAVGAGIFGFIKDFSNIQKTFGNVVNAFTQVRQQGGSFASAIGAAFSASAQSATALEKAIFGVGTAVGVAFIGIKTIDAIVDHFTTTIDEAKDKADNSIGDYKKTKSDLENVNTELKTTQDRIRELEAHNGALKPLEQAELDKLKQYNEELLSQQHILENGLKNKQLTAANDAADYLSTDTRYATGYQENIGTKWFGTDYVPVKQTYKSGSIIDRLATNKELLDKYSAQLENDKDNKPLQRLVNDLQAQVTADYDSISEYMQYLTDDEGGILGDNQAIYDSAKAVLDSFKTKEQLAEEFQAGLDKIKSKSNVKEQYDKLVAQAKENSENGGIQLKDIMADEYEEMLSEFEKQGYTAADLKIQINAEAEILNKGELKSQLETALRQDISDIKTDKVKVEPDVDISFTALEEKKAKIQEVFDTLSSEQQQTVLAKIQDVDWSSWDLGEIPDKVRELADATEDLSGKTEELTGTFEDMDSLFGDEAKFGGQVDNFVQQLDTLKQALDQFNKGELTEGDMFDLQKQFGELLGNSDFENFGQSLSNAIGTLLGDTTKAAGGLKEFGDAVEGAGGETEEATSLVQLFDQAISEVGSNSQMGQWLEEYKQHFIDFYTEVKTAQETLNDFTGYQSSVSGIQSSNASPTGLSLDEIKELESAYKNLGIEFNREDLFVGTANGIRLNTQALDELNQKVQNTTLADLKDELDGLLERQAGGETGLEDDISDAEYLISQYEGLTSAYANYVRSKSQPNNRDPLFSLDNDFKNAQDAIDHGFYAEAQGLIDLFLSADQITGDIQTDWETLNGVIGGASGQLEQFGFKWTDLFSKSEDGGFNSDGLFKFLGVLEQVHGEIIQTNEDGSRTISMTGEQLDQIAEEFGTNAGVITMILSALQDVDPNLHFTMDADTSGVEEGASEVESLRSKIESNPIVQTIKSKVEGVVEKGKEFLGNVFGNLFGGGSSEGEEEETQTIHIKQDPDPFEVKITVPGGEGEGDSQTYKVHIEADYGEGGDGLAIKINPPSGDAVDENGVYTLQTAIAGVANDEGAFTLSVPSPEGAEGDTYTLSVAAGGIADSSGAISLTVNPEGANEDGSFEITVQAANDGKVLVSAVGPDGSDTISAVVEPNLTALGTAITAFQEELNNNPLKVAVEQSTTHQTSSGQTAGGGGRSFGTSEEPSETAPTEIPGKLVIEEVEYNIEEDPEVDGILNVNEVEENIEEQPEIEGSVKATELDVSGIETPSIDADININGGATLTVDSTAVDQAVTDATQTVQGFNGQTGTAILDGDNSSLASSVSESETLVDGLNSKTATPAFSADTSQLDSSVSESEAKVDALDAKTAEPTATLNDQASGVISNISKALTDLDGKTAHTTVVTTHVTQGGTDAGGGGGKFATGTLTTAHASGTAYNVFNYRPAYSNGKVALSKDEIALVNELGKTLPKCTVMYIIYHGKSVKSQKWLRPRLNRVVTTRATSIAI